MRGSINHRIASPSTSSRTLGIAACVLAVAMAMTACASEAASTAQAVDNAVESIENELDGTTDEAVLDERSVQVADLLRQNGATSLATMVSAIDFDDLTGSTEFTFFAPNDDAFLSMTADQTADLLGNPDEILAILRNHVVSERVDTARVVELDAVESEAGNSLAVAVVDETITIAGASITQSDLAVADGVVHVVDALIIP